jgi:hypothetical protein
LEGVGYGRFFSTSYTFSEAFLEFPSSSTSYEACGVVVSFCPLIAGDAGSISLIVLFLLVFWHLLAARSGLDWAGASFPT